MSEASYDGSPIIINPWPQWVGGEDGSWARHFTFEFETAVAGDALAAANVDQADLMVQVAEGATPCQIRLTATTRANAWSDAVFYDQFYTLFARLEEVFGRIHTIEGQAREMWRPFRR
ncbi:hypothetical protein [Nannocystis sp. SCPEA4]|uniref:hypothetical protein n=1 Tax=Nannocystis sp. SCPEA4 TaxID=2996787 RepID=UPI002270B620|nr:hypothetical protein [Nannocystis sp. SCPEA4]MCY1058289.1 hypothetical protein [Nannocystis sp. SCPEA4]